jgi:hypothetical protein
MKTTKRIKIVNSKPQKDQQGLEGFINMEFDVLATWKSRTWDLEKGQVAAVLRNDKDLNINSQPSVLNENEYIFV